MVGSSQLAAAFAADNVVTNLHFLLLIMVPGFAWLARYYTTDHMDNATEFSVQERGPVHHIADLSVAGLLSALALAFGIAAAGNLLAEIAGYPQFAILVITALALGIATLFPRHMKRLSGDRQAGDVMMFIFLGSIGASADVWELIEIAPLLFVFAMIIVTIHVVVLFLIGYFLKMDLGELAMASAVCVGGPSSAAALASAKGWQDLLIPGILAGSFGYAIGSFIGISVTTWLT